VAVAEKSDQITGEDEGACTVIHHDKVVPCTVHLGELQSHQISMVPHSFLVTPQWKDDALKNEISSFL
jgi:hypothetical protein